MNERLLTVQAQGKTSLLDAAADIRDDENKLPREKKPGVVATALEKDFIFKIGIMSKGEVAGKNLVRVTAEHAGIADSK